MLCTSLLTKFACQVSEAKLHFNRKQRNYQVSKEIVHELNFGDIAVMQI